MGKRWINKETRAAAVFRKDISLQRGVRGRLPLSYYYTFFYTGLIATRLDTRKRSNRPGHWLTTGYRLFSYRKRERLLGLIVLLRKGCIRTLPLPHNKTLPQSSESPPLTFSETRSTSTQNRIDTTTSATALYSPLKRTSSTTQNG